MSPAVAEGVDALGRLPYRERPYAARNWGDPLHSLCSYPSKLKPGIAHFVVRLFSDPGETVFDPFSGCGTIPLEAALLGRRALGSDLNPLATILTRAKVGMADRGAVLECVRDLESAMRGAPAPDPGPLGEIADFYHPDTLREVVAARRVINDALGSGELLEAWSMVAAATMHLLHGNRPYALSRRSHNVIPIPPKGPAEYKPLVTALEAKLARAMAAERPGAVAGEAFEAPADRSPVPSASVDLVATSPPFLGTTDFLRQNRIRLWFAGWDYERQRAQKESGTFLEFARDMAPYRGVFREVHRVLRPGGRCVMHMGVVKSFDMAAEAEVFAKAAGLSVVARIYEDAAHLESHGRTQRGATATHVYLVAEKERG